MASLNDILSWFKSGLFPTEQQFSDTWLSFWHKSEKIPQDQIFGLKETIESAAKGLIYQNPVTNAADLPTTYPTALPGWASMVTSEGYIYSYNGTTWSSTGLKAFPEDVATKEEVNNAIKTHIVKIEQIKGSESYVKLDTSIGTTWGYYINGSNVQTAAVGVGYTDYIEVEPSIELRIDGYMYPVGGCMYNSLKQPIGGLIFPLDAETALFTPSATCKYIKINIKEGVEYFLGIDSDFEKYRLIGLEPSKEFKEDYDLLKQDNTLNKTNISNLELIKADKSALSLKVNRQFEISSTFENKGYVHPTNPFWPRTSAENPWKFFQFNLKAKAKMYINEIKIAGCYIEDVALNIGTGNINVRVYKDIVINSNKSDFSGATLLRKSSVPIATFFANSMKGATKADLLTRLQSGERGYTTFEFELLELQRDDIIYIYFGVDDDSIYTNTPNTATPSCRFSIVASNSTGINVSLFSTYINSTFLGGTTESAFSPTNTYIGVSLSSKEESSQKTDGYIAINSRDIYTFVGATNTVLDALFAAKPKARIAMIGHNTLAGRTLTGQDGVWFRRLVDVQQQLADYWGCPYLALWQKLNWVKNENVNTFATWCPDEVHPYTNPIKITTAIGEMSESDYIIHNHVKEFLRPIFSDWTGKKVATYGTSIPYGGKYSILAVNELGGTAENYCSSGSYIRRGNTYQVNQANSFTNIDSANTYRNYQKDMLDLIGTADEPDLFIFDFGINDFNLDQVDFMIQA